MIIITVYFVFSLRCENKVINITVIDVFKVNYYMESCCHYFFFLWRWLSRGGKLGGFRIAGGSRDCRFLRIIDFNSRISASTTFLPESQGYGSLGQGRGYIGAKANCSPKRLRYH